MPSSLRKRGVTLIELLVSSSIGTLLLMFVLQCMAAMTSAGLGACRRYDQGHQARVALEWMYKDAMTMTLNPGVKIAGKNVVIKRGEVLSGYATSPWSASGCPGDVQWIQYVMADSSTSGFELRRQILGPVETWMKLRGENVDGNWESDVVMLSGIEQLLLNFDELTHQYQLALELKGSRNSGKRFGGYLPLLE